MDAGYTNKDSALEIAYQFGGLGGDRRKMWVIDQMVRRLLGCNNTFESKDYGKFIAGRGEWDVIPLSPDDIV